MSPPLGAFNVWGTDMVFFIFLRDRVEKLQRSRTRNFLTFVNTTAIAYGQKIARSLKILVLCNSSRVYKRQKITSTMSLSYPGSRWSGYRGSKKKISFLFFCAETWPTCSGSHTRWDGRVSFFGGPWLNVWYGYDINETKRNILGVPPSAAVALWLDRLWLEPSWTYRTNSRWVDRGLEKKTPK